MEDLKVGDRVRTNSVNFHDYGTVRKVLPRKMAVEVNWDRKCRWLLVEQPFERVVRLPPAPSKEAIAAFNEVTDRFWNDDE